MCYSGINNYDLAFKRRVGVIVHWVQIADQYTKLIHD